MAKRSKLLTALGAHQGRDYKLERQAKLRKQAEKKKRKKQEAEALDGASGEGAGDDSVEEDAIETDVTAKDRPAKIRHEHKRQFIPKQQTNGAPPLESEADGLDVWETDDDNMASGKDVDEIDEIDEDEDEEEEEDAAADIPLSDLDSLASSEKGDLLPFQRLTINNTSALTSAYNSIALASTLPFSATQALTSAAAVSIPDINDDLSRELAFYKQCLSAAEEGRALLKKEGIPFSRPSDYFAEMVKSDEQMGKIRQKMVDDAARKKASGDAKRQRQLKKFGKQVQVAKEQERAKERKGMLEKIDMLKRKRKNADIGATNEEDMFDVALDDATKENRGAGGPSAGNGRDGPRASKRQRKDQRFGFGGKKRFAKSGDAISSGDVSGYSSKKMKGDRGKPKRLGKSRRAKKP